MSEVARLDVLLGADISQFQSKMKIADQEIVNFNKLGNAASQLKPFSGATSSALAAANSVEKLNNVLAQLKIEQAGATSAKELTAYNNAIKVATSELKGLSQVGSSGGIGAIGKSLTEGLGSVRQLAYILPGIGMAGIFNLAFEAISKGVQELGLFDSKTKELTQDQKDLAKAMEGFEEAAAKDVLKFMELSEIASSTDNPYNIRLDAVKKLRDEYPNYLKNLSDEQILTGQTADALKHVNEALLAKLTLEAGEEQIVKLLKQRFDIQVKLNDLQDKQLTTAGFAASLKDATGLAKGLGVQLQASVNESIPLNKKYADSIKNITAQVNSLFNILKTSINQAAPLDLFDPKPAKTKDVEDYTKALEKYLAALSKLVSHGIPSNEQAPYTPVNYIGAVTKLSDIEAKASLEHMRDVLNKAAVKVFSSQGILSDVSLLNDKEVQANFDKLKQGLGEIVKITDTLSQAFSQVFTTLITGGTHAFKALEQSLVGLITKLIAAVIEAALLSAILSAFTGGTSLLVGGSGFTNILKQLLGGGLQFAHADGGIFTQPTQWGNHLIGEKGPEALVPLDKLSNMMSIGGSQRIIVEGRISGNDLILVQNRAQTAINRNYGNNFNRH